MSSTSRANSPRESGYYVGYPSRLCVADDGIILLSHRAFGTWQHADFLLEILFQFRRGILIIRH